MAEIEGFANGPYERLVDVLSSTLDDGSDLGASVAVTVDGEFVADFWGGFADADRTTPWQRDTIVNTWSTTKTMTGLVALMLVDRGLVDPDAPVATYWPEFAQNGKEGVLVRHVLSHSSGVCGWAQPVVQEDVYDQDRSAKILAAQAPWFEPGSVVGYQAIVHGHLVGEVVRRVTGRSLGTFFAEEVAGPLGADFHIGLAPEHDARVTPVLPPPPLPFDVATLDPASPMYKAFTGPPVGADFANTPQWRRAEIGGANGHGNARSVARVQSVVANGGELDGVRLLSPETVDRIFAVQAEGVDVVLAVPVRHGLGYGLPSETVPYVADNGRVCFWGGWGGSMVVVDAARRTVFSYMMNKMAPGVVGGPTAEKLLTVFNTI
jgi:CubicO group peptidase (beta-lactamase class C family)